MLVRSLTEDAALGIMRVERERNKLTSLGLAVCNIGPTGAAEIADCLKVMAVLKSIDLRGNDLGTEGWCAIFNALKENTANKIESWNLSGQKINDEIAKTLAEYISVSAVLTSLE